MRTVGFIFECGADGPDVKVCKQLIRLIDPTISMKIRAMGNAKNLREDCGEVAQLLLAECSMVFVVWDLLPKWPDQEHPCRREQRTQVIESLNRAQVDLARIVLVCIQAELESWLIADITAVKAVLQRQKQPHRLGLIKSVKHPDRDPNPKKTLLKWFRRELGRDYVDYRDAEVIVKELADVKGLKRSESFTYFYRKLTR